MQPYTLVKTFTATMRRDRELLGERVTAWLADNPGVQIIDKKVRLSSGKQYHCLTLSLLCAGNESKPRRLRSGTRKIVS